MWTILIAIVVLCALSSLRLRFHEDITDFLPFDSSQRTQIEQLQQQDNASKIIILSDDVAALDSLIETSQWNIQTGFSQSEIAQQIATYYSSFRYSFSAADTARIDSMLTREYIFAHVSARKSQLQMPLAGAMSAEICNDPLALFPSFADTYKNRFENLYFAFIESPYGSSETKHNAALVDSIQTAVNTIKKVFPEANIRLNGAPVIAVGNARQIKHDSFLAIAIALVLIILLLWRSLNSIRSMVLIVAATAFGVLFALGIQGIVHPNTSLIVIGISSVIIGIAVNYPLHLLVHRQYTATMRQTIEEVVSPLIIGNITTVGAFLTLLPLKSVALRDLGLFCACMLVGTILFSVFFLPHFRFSTPRFDVFSRSSRFLNWTSSLKPERSKYLPWIILVLTLVFGYFSRFTAFDTHLSHLNYMTPQQRADIALFATDKPVASDSIWCDYWSRHSEQTIQTLHEAAELYGFRPSAFTPFESLITSNGQRPTTNDLKISNINSQLSTITLACSIIVFIFLWLSFRRLKYAIVAFLPMVLSWLWILGLMYLFGWQFNIVNIILATFIFGQGDDYTIFITEGLITTENRVQQYKNSIILSALIMFIGIGALIVAKHPALHSLATVTMLGMGCVVLMAYIIPPLIFKFLKHD